MRNKAEVLEWISYAESDLHTAEFSLRDDHARPHTVCFLCHAASEKYLKALLKSFGWKTEKTHDLVYLTRLLADRNVDVSSIVESMAEINPYITETRYPGDLDFDAFTIEMAKKAADIARHLATFVENKIT